LRVRALSALEAFRTENEASEAHDRRLRAHALEALLRDRLGVDATADDSGTAVVDGLAFRLSGDRWEDVTVELECERCGRWAPFRVHTLAQLGMLLAGDHGHTHRGCPDNRPPPPSVEERLVSTLREFVEAEWDRLTERQAPDY
jgi:hypothetical protein